MSISVYERESLASISLAQQCPIVRDRLRPAHLRDERYDKQYDFHTLFYDAFVTSDRKHVRLIGPVLSNLAPYILAGDIFELSPDGKLRALPFQMYQKRKVTYLDIDMLKTVSGPLVLQLGFGGLGEFEIHVNSVENSLFSNRRVVFTLFKYEPLEWLRDWVEFNVKYHGADAFLLYHNDSDDFTAEDVADVLRSVSGVAVGAVLNWPFPYGPDGGPDDNWDSNFCQMGMMAHARWRFLNEAKSVLNGDIDELVITKDHQSIFEMVERSEHQYIQIPAKWSGYGPNDFRVKELADRRYRHMTHLVEGADDKPAQNKWAVVPTACPEDSRWITHRIGRMQGEELSFNEAGLRHFKDINTHWKLERTSYGSAAKRMRI